jgi:serine protease
MKTRSLLLVSSCALALTAAVPAHADWVPYLPDSADDGPTAQTTTAPYGDFIPGEIVVDFKDDVSDSDIEEVASALHISLRDNSPEIKDDGKIDVADVDPAQEDAILARLNGDPRVEAAEPMAIARAYAFTPNDPKYAEQWHMKRAGAETAWEYTCGEGVTVAVIDTGVACYDEGGFMKGTDLAGTTCVAGWNFVGKNALAADDQGHGSHVAGTIAQTTNNGIGVAGLANCARLMPVKVLSKQGWGTMADVAEGIRWAADHGAQVENLSLGASQKSKVVENAVTYAYKKGVTVVAAAGNSGRSVGYPAAYAGAIAVSATDKNDNIAWFSSRGPEVAIGAPGVGVTQQTICDAGKNKCEQWGVFNGTSMASPHVAGAAALIVAQGITDPDAVRATLQASATPKEDKNLFGAGILEAGKAAVRTHWVHLGVRIAALLVIAGLVLRRIKQKGGKLEKGKGKVFGAILAGVGLLPFLPLTGVPARAGALRPLAELLMRPFGEWDMLLSLNVHKWLPLASAAPLFLLVTLFFNNKRLRPFVGGFALGTAALMVQIGISGETFFALGGVGLKIFCVLNAAIAAWIARFTLDSKKS